MTLETLGLNLEERKKFLHYAQIFKLFETGNYVSEKNFDRTTAEIVKDTGLNEEFVKNFVTPTMMNWFSSSHMWFSPIARKNKDLFKAKCYTQLSSNVRAILLSRKNLSSPANEWYRLFEKFCVKVVDGIWSHCTPKVEHFLMRGMKLTNENEF